MWKQGRRTRQVYVNASDSLRTFSLSSFLAKNMARNMQSTLYGSGKQARARVDTFVHVGSPRQKPNRGTFKAIIRRST